MGADRGGSLGALHRRASRADVRRVDVKTTDEDGAQRSSGVVAIAFGEPSRSDSGTHQGKLPLSPFERMWNEGIPKITRYLTFNEAASLMVADRRSRLSLYADPLLRLDEIARELGRLGCNELITRIRAIDSDISTLREESRARHYLPGTTLGLSAKKAQRANLQALDESLCARAVQEQGLQKLQPGIEEVVFHFASARQQGPRQGPAPSTSAPRLKSQRSLNQAVHDGNVELVRSGLREFLALPQALTLDKQKVSWLRQPSGMPTLASFGQRGCFKLDAHEQRQCEAIHAYVHEIVSSPYLSPIEKEELCVKPGGLDIVGHCLRNNNPAVAALIILGIHESSAVPQLKQQMFAAMGVARARPMDRLESVITALRWRADRAPEWVEGLLARLAGVKEALQGSTES